eukprot:3809987-Ditylum_brightwellii.AAC.1
MPSFNDIHEPQKDSQTRLMEEIAKVNALDTPSYYQAANRPDAELFVKTMEEKIAALYDLNAWEVIDQSNVPYTVEGTRYTVVESTCTFKIKKFPDGLVKKYEAWLCVRGDQQVEDMDYLETYSPIISWSTVQTVLALAANLGLKSRQVDYTGFAPI